jgi:hypothetical protein
MEANTRPAVNADRTAPRLRPGFLTSEFWILLAALAALGALTFADKLPAALAGTVLAAAPAVFQLLRNALKKAHAGELRAFAELALDHAERAAKREAETNAAGAGALAKLLQNARGVQQPAAAVKLPVAPIVPRTAPPAPPAPVASVAPAASAPPAPSSTVGNVIPMQPPCCALALLAALLLGGCGAQGGALRARASAFAAREGKRVIELSERAAERSASSWIDRQIGGFAK